MPDAIDLSASRSEYKNIYNYGDDYAKAFDLFGED